MNWLDLEMGTDMTGHIEYGHQEAMPRRMTMSQGEQLLLLPAPEKKPPKPPPIDDEEKKVSAVSSEKTED